MHHAPSLISDIVCALSGDSTGAGLPDLAATLQALAQTGLQDSGAGVPDLDATLRAAAATAANAAASGGPAGEAESDDLLKE